MSLQFENLDLHPQLMQAVEMMGFEQPTPIQEQAIPVLLEGQDVVGQAQTGTGKTAAFVLPMLQRVLLKTTQPGKEGIQALVLAPTRELAIQVAKAAVSMARLTQVQIMAVYGGQSYDIQKRRIQRGVDIVVGTPGRIIDLMRQNVLDLSKVDYFVLDEADEMLEMGFIEDVETIMAQIQAERQMALFSATMPEVVRRLSERYLNAPAEIKINPQRRTVAETEQRFTRVRETDKAAALIRFLEVEEVKSALIFARTKMRAQDLAEELIRRGYPAESLHGDLSQARREFVLNRFRQGTVKLLVATDVAARGLDIEDVSHVFNYDAPGDAEDYIHRIGRTGRAGRKGIAISFFTPRERSRQGQIEAYVRQPMIEATVPSREEILFKRDERFLERLNEQLSQDGIAHQRSLIDRLLASNVDLADIAAAAIQLARAGESNMPVEEIIEPVAERRSARKPRTEAAFERPARGGKRATEWAGEERQERQPQERPAKASWQTEQPVQAERVNRADFDKSQPHNGGKQPFGKRNSRKHEPGYVRLKMNLGHQHGIRPSDVVGAIATEVGIPGRAIGEIDIRGNFTFVDVSEKHVRQVLRDSVGQYLLRGKPVMLKLAN